jgi:hypothetical protein
MKKAACLTFCAVFAFAFAVQAYGAEGSSDETNWKKDPEAWNVEFYPVYVWAPFMGAKLTLPTFPDSPNLPDLPGGGAPSSSVTSGIKGAAFVAFRVEKGKWVVDANALWAGMSVDKVSPKVDLGLDIIFGQGMVGYEVLPGLTAEGGVRRMALNVSVTLFQFAQLDRKPGVWDPLVGMSYRRALGRKWRMDLHADGGGFGVGSQNTYALTAQMDYRFSRHLGMTLGYGLLHFKIADTVLQRTLTIDQTLNGPILGFGIYF